MSSLVLLYRIRSPGSVSLVALSSACLEKVVSLYEPNPLYVCMYGNCFEKLHSVLSLSLCYSYPSLKAVVSFLPTTVPWLEPLLANNSNNNN